MTNRTLVVAVIAFLIGVLFSPILTPKVQAAGDGWTSLQVKEALRLLTEIAEK